MIAARSGVNRSLTGDQIVSGAPAMPHEVFIKAQAVVPRLPELRQQVRDLEHRVRSIEARTARVSTKAKSKKALQVIEWVISGHFRARVTCK